MESLPLHESPDTQLRLDLADLNVTRLADGSVPLYRWLSNAYRLTYPQDVGEIFSEAMKSVERANPQIELILRPEERPKSRGTLPLMVSSVALVLAVAALIASTFDRGATSPRAAPSSDSDLSLAVGAFLQSEDGRALVKGNLVSGDVETLVRDAILKPELIEAIRGPSLAGVRVLHSFYRWFADRGEYSTTLRLDEPALLWITASGHTHQGSAYDTPELDLRILMGGNTCAIDNEMVATKKGRWLGASATCMKHVAAGQHDIRIQRTDTPVSKKVNLQISILAIAATAAPSK